MRPEIVYVILGMALVTYLTRVSFLVLVGRAPIPGSVIKGLKYIPIGILAAIVVPGVLIVDGRIDFSLSNFAIAGGVVSALIAARWKNVLLAMLGGVLVVVVLRFAA
ncbi:MAG: AzlD domain-containing protein [Ignavibacteriales bacterium]